MKFFKHIVFLMVLSVLFVSCGKKHINQIVEPTPLYNKAIALYKKGKYEKASKKFLEFKNRFPFDPRINEVEIKYCDSLYKAELYIEAENAYLEFIKLHPKNKLVPYAYYQLGMIQFNQISTIDRDQSKLFYAYKYFSFLVNNFPDSKFAVVANHRIHECKRKMAKNNFYIGYFYYKQGRYKASIARFKKILKKFPGFIDDKVLFYLGKSYLNLKDKKNAIKYLKMVTQFPKSKYYSRAMQTLKDMKPEKFRFWARFKEYYFMDEEDLKDRYYTVGKKEFSYPPASNYTYDKLALLQRQRTLVTLNTSKEIKKEFQKTEEISKVENKKNQIPVNISANQVSYSKDESKVIFKGNTVATRGDFIIKCDEIIAFLDKKNKNIYKVEASKGVDIYYLTKEGSCEKATYFVNEDKIVLEGNPSFRDGKNIVTGKKIIYFVKTQQVFVVGSMEKRGKIIIRGE